MGAPVGAAGVAALQGALNWGLADAAGLAFAAVDPEVVAGVGCAGSAALAAAVRDDQVVGVFEDVGGEELLGGFYDLFRLTTGEGADLEEGVELEGEADFGFEDVAYAGEYALTQEDVGYLFAWIALDSLYCGYDIEIFL